MRCGSCLIGQKTGLQLWKGPSICCCCCCCCCCGFSDLGRCILQEALLLPHMGPILKILVGFSVSRVFCHRIDERQRVAVQGCGGRDEYSALQASQER